MKKLLFFIITLAIIDLHEAIGQWNTDANNIYNTNSGNVGIGNSTPATLLYVAKNMTEPNITVRNLGGTGGATAWNSALKMHAAGYLTGDNGFLWLGIRGTYSYYWCNSQYDSTEGRYLQFDEYGCIMTSAIKANGYSVRCLRD